MLEHRVGLFIVVALVLLPLSTFADEFPDCDNRAMAFQSGQETDAWSCIEAEVHNAYTESGSSEAMQTSVDEFKAVTVVSGDVADSFKRRQANSSQLAKDIRDVFPGDSISLLSRLDKQFSIGIQYSSDTQNQSLRDSRNRSATIPIDFSLGLSDAIEASVSLPIVYSNQELQSSSAVSTTDEYGLGDVSLNLSARLRRETQNRPRIMLNLGIGAPTGKTGNPANIDQLSLGSGFWSASAGATFSKSLDPATVFLSFRYQHIFEDKLFGIDVKPGSSFEYGYGVGMSLNSALSVAGRIGGALQSNTSVNGQIVEGSNSEPLQLITTSTLRLNRKSRLESSLSMGMNKDADDASLGMTYIRDM